MTASTTIDSDITYRDPIKIVCSTTGCGEFYGQLSKWMRVYSISGETWVERCPKCGREYMVRMEFEELDRNGNAVEKTNYWKYWS
jgi:hypothetical protein